MTRFCHDDDDDGDGGGGGDGDESMCRHLRIMWLGPFTLGSGLARAGGAFASAI